jgi:REP element-mobilizing transposase RayT
MMPGTFSQLYVQYVFAVKGRQNLIKQLFENEVYSYIAGIIRNKGQKPLAVNGMPDHIHVLVGLKPVMKISDLIRDIKNNSTNFINEKGWLKQKFSWQEGRIKSNIMKKDHFSRSIHYYLKDFILNLMKSIYLNSMNRTVAYDTPSGLHNIAASLLYYLQPFGLSYFSYLFKSRRDVINMEN